MGQHFTRSSHHRGTYSSLWDEVREGRKTDLKEVEERRKDKLEEDLLTTRMVYQSGAGRGKRAQQQEGREWRVDIAHR